MSVIREALQRDQTLSYASGDDVTSGAVCAARTDAQLIEMIQAGDETAFEQLFDRHKRTVAKTAARYFQRHELIEDIVQVSFTKAYFELDKFRGENAKSFPAWIMRIAANACLDNLRTRKRRPENLECELTAAETESVFDFVRAAGVDDESKLITRDLAEKLLARMPEDDRALLNMFYVEEMSVAEIGELLGWSRSKVKIRAWRARNAMRKLLKTFM